MCGIVGVFGQVLGSEEKAFRDLLRVDAVRGEDSTGIMAIGKDGTARCIKDVVLPQSLLATKAANKMFASLNNIGFVGHNRAATRGGVDRDMAHPFIAKHIAGVHNGTLNSMYELEHGRTQESDSRAIVETIAARGIKETWKVLDGAAALVWWDANESTLNFIRNSFRPFHFRYTEGRRSIFFASEKWMLCDGLIQRNGRSFIHLEEQTWHTNPNFHFRLSYSNGKLTEETEELVPFSRPVLSPSPHTSGSFSSALARKHVWTEYGWVPVEDYEAYHGTLTDDERREKRFQDVMASFPPEEEEGAKQEQLPLAHKKGGKKKCTGGTHNRDLHPLAEKNLSRKQFRKQYKQCGICAEALEYKSAVIIDKYMAVCGDCLALADGEGMSISALKGA